jgi:hypothetical protein
MKNADVPFVAVIGGLRQLDANKSAATKAAGNVIGGELAKAGFGLVRVLTTSARKPPLRTDKFAALWRIAAPVHPIRKSNCAESGYCELIRP